MTNSCAWKPAPRWWPPYLAYFFRNILLFENLSDKVCLKSVAILARRLSTLVIWWDCDKTWCKKQGPFVELKEFVQQEAEAARQGYIRAQKSCKRLTLNKWQSGQTELRDDLSIPVRNQCTFSSRLVVATNFISNFFITVRLTCWRRHRSLAIFQNSQVHDETSTLQNFENSKVGRSDKVAPLKTVFCYSTIDYKFSIT